MATTLWLTYLKTLRAFLMVQRDLDETSPQGDSLQLQKKKKYENLLLDLGVSSMSFSFLWN